MGHFTGGIFGNRERISYKKLPGLISGLISIGQQNDRCFFFVNNGTLVFFQKTIVENLLEQYRSLIRRRTQMIYRMTELNQFQRSKDRLTEMLYSLMKTTLDTHNDSYIRTIQMSIQTLDVKIEEFRDRVSDQRLEMFQSKAQSLKSEV